MRIYYNVFTMLGNWGVWNSTILAGKGLQMGSKRWIKRVFYFILFYFLTCPHKRREGGGEFELVTFASLGVVITD
jgi:hypothetical protein